MAPPCLCKSAAELHINADEPAALEALGSSNKSATAQAAYYALTSSPRPTTIRLVIGFNPLRGDFNDDGVLDAKDGQPCCVRAGIRRSDRGSPMDMTTTAPSPRMTFLSGKDFIVWQQDVH